MMTETTKRRNNKGMIQILNWCKWIQPIRHRPRIPWAWNKQSRPGIEPRTYTKIVLRGQGFEPWTYKTCAHEDQKNMWNTLHCKHFIHKIVHNNAAISNLINITSNRQKRFICKKLLIKFLWKNSFLCQIEVLWTLIWTFFFNLPMKERWGHQRHL